MSLDGTGYTPRLVDEWLADIEADEHANIDPALDVQADSPLGQINGIVAAALAEQDANTQAVYDSAFVDRAEGESLEALCALTGVRRLPASPSLVTLTLAGTPSTLIPAGRVVRSQATGSRWATKVDVTLSGGGSGTVAAACLTPGPTTANAGTITTIDTPVTGWTSVTNATDATRGRNRESDGELRTRRQQLLFAQGNATVNALLDAVLRVPGVTQARVFENPTNSTVDSVPARSIEAVVVGGTNQAIRDALFVTKSAGVATYGTTTGTSTDSQGFSHEVDFSRPTTKGVGLRITAYVDQNSYIGDTALKQLLADYVSALGMGRSVSFAATLAKIVDAAGVLTSDDGAVDPVLEMKLLTGSYGTTSLPITPRQIADLQVSDIVLTSR